MTDPIEDPWAFPIQRWLMRPDITQTTPIELLSADHVIGTGKSRQQLCHIERVEKILAALGWVESGAIKLDTGLSDSEYWAGQPRWVLNRPNISGA